MFNGRKLRTVAWLVTLATSIGYAGTITLTATPDTTVTAGSTIGISVSGAAANDLVFLAAGQTLGTTSVDLGLTSFDLGLAQPFALLPVGVGGANLSFAIPSIPSALQGMTFHLQALSLGFSFTPGTPPMVTACTSNLDALSF